MTWNPALYDARHAFVYAHGAALVEWLAPQPGEHILDLGSGTGHLTAQIAQVGTTVIGLDSSPEMIAQAKAAYPQLDFRLADARDFTIDAPVDAVFSNAVLHWVQPAEAAAQCIARALRPGGRFVAELGGYGNISHIATALVELTGRPLPWYYPSVAEYATVLQHAGLEVRQALLFDRPTRLDDGPAGLRHWLAMFAGSFFAGLDAAEYERILTALEARLRPHLWQEDAWYADYRRLRVMAVKV